MYKKIILFVHLIFSFAFLFSQQIKNDTSLILKADRVFDGEQMHEEWIVVIKNDKIIATGLSPIFPTPFKIIELKGCTLLPELIEGHSHLFLHSYNETSWNDQVLKESRSERILRAAIHAKNTLLAGFTTIRDLGTEGAGYDDVGLKQAIGKGIIPGPRMLVATRAIVATGSYGPRELTYDIETPKGAAEADGTDGLTKEVRTQIGKGADIIKVYADYGWGLDKEQQPTFTVGEMKIIVEVATASGRPVVAHASTVEGMRRAIIAGVTTIEHGNEGTFELFKMMKEKNIAYCPTLSASDAIAQYRGWKKGTTPDPEMIKAKHKSFTNALQAGVIICMGGDVGVFPHGENAREMEMMAEYGMNPLNVLRATTSVNADVFKISKITGRIKPGLFADILVVKGDPSVNINDIRNVQLVMKGGIIYVNKL